MLLCLNMPPAPPGSYASVNLENMYCQKTPTKVTAIQKLWAKVHWSNSNLSINSISCLYIGDSFAPPSDQDPDTLVSDSLLESEEEVWVCYNEFCNYVCAFFCMQSDSVEVWCDDINELELSKSASKAKKPLNQLFI